MVDSNKSKSKIMIIGETIEQALWYAEYVIAKKETPIKFTKYELVTEDTIYVLKSMNINLDSLRGYKVDEIWLVGTATIGKILDRYGNNGMNILFAITRDINLIRLKR